MNFQPLLGSRRNYSMASFFRQQLTRLFSLAPGLGLFSSGIKLRARTSCWSFHIIPSIH
ncbi:UNVERIFIED_CONTAM: hypothetical protein Slati_4526100 [Sesamum latifolium]|uniref:Uncharacterized protein n=1 Tax=Sesamum latifolium TaxID=2727402 RepID=A0AAW2SGN3_9LAMI